MNRGQALVSAVREIPVIGDTLVRQLLNAGGRSTRAERRVVRTLLATNLEAGLTSINKLAASANVSAPTVLRLITNLGFENYAAFQDQLTKEFEERVITPGSWREKCMERLDVKDAIDAVAMSCVSAIQNTFLNIQEKDLNHIIDLISNKNRKLYATGGSTTNIFAQLLVARLYQLRPNVRAVGSISMGIRLEEELSAIRPKDIVIVFDFRRYEKRTIDFARRAHEGGANIILITDHWLSPIADFAKNVIAVVEQAPWGYDCYIAACAVIELLFAHLLFELGDEAWSRIAMLEQYQPGLLGTPPLVEGKSDNEPET